MAYCTAFEPYLHVDHVALCDEIVLPLVHSESGRGLKPHCTVHYIGHLLVYEYAYREVVYMCSCTTILHSFLLEFILWQGNESKNVHV